VEDPGDGTIPENEVVGRASLIVWPPGRWRILRIPATFEQQGIVRQAAASAQSGSAQSGSAQSGSAQSGSAQSRSAQSGPAVLAAAPGGRLAPEPPYLPLGGGLAGAVPVAFLRRRFRLSARRRCRPGSRR
jgi:hypothetical protein